MPPRNNHKKIFGIILAILVIIFAVVAFKAHAPTGGNTETLPPAVSGNGGDLVSFSIIPGAHVHGILSYRGTLKGSYFFEANVRIMILDANKNVLKSSNAVAKTDWMTEGPVDFEGNIDFTGLPAGAGYFRIANDNPSGDPIRDKFIDIPIVIE